MPRWESPAVEVWNQQDIAQFLRYSEAESKVMHPLYLLAIATGMRRGELAGLQWNHVDLEDGSLRVEQSRVTVAGGTEMVSPKTDASRRMIRLSGVGLDALRSAAIFQQHQREALGSAWKETGFVFTGPDGLPPNPDRITKRFQKDSRRAGVRVIRFHDLRHTFASNALRHGVNPRDVCAILGHSKVETTMSIYVQFMPGAHEDAMAKINGILFGDRSES
jgi:integrase